jgi:putative ABC transport system permease protein
MVMAVLERQRETALLATVGWSPRQLAMLVMGEAIAVSILGCAIGLALGVAASELLVRALDLLDVIAPESSAWTLLRGVIIGLAIGVLGGLYPTGRVARQRPGALLAQG